MIHVEVSVPVYPTEDPKKVLRAISSLFAGIEPEQKTPEPASEPAKPGARKVAPSFRLAGEGGLDMLLTLHGLIRREEIIDSIREKVFNRRVSTDGLSVSFLLNKQAAFVGIPSIPAEEEPLGSIEVSIRAESPEELERLFEWLLPLTENGVPIIEVGMDYVERC